MCALFVYTVYSMLLSTIIHMHLLLSINYDPRNFIGIFITWIRKKYTYVPGALLQNNKQQYNDFINTKCIFSRIFL